MIREDTPAVNVDPDIRADGRRLIGRNLDLDAVTLAGDNFDAAARAGR